jgi:hypothetical protein
MCDCPTGWLVGALGYLLQRWERGDEWGLSKPHGGGGWQCHTTLCHAVGCCCCCWVWAPCISLWLHLLRWSNPLWRRSSEMHYSLHVFLLYIGASSNSHLTLGPTV